MENHEKAKLLVAQHHNRYIEANVVSTAGGLKVEPEQCLVVWYNYTLGNWKALVVVMSHAGDSPSGLYYEVTYDRDRKMTYLDAYRKVDNMSIPDGASLES